MRTSVAHPSPGDGVKIRADEDGAGAEDESGRRAGAVRHGAPQSCGSVPASASPGCRDILDR